MNDSKNLEESDQKQTRYTWIIVALMATGLFSISSFLLGIGAEKGVVAKYLLSVGFVINSLSYMLIAFLVNYINGRRVWSFIDNDWVYKNGRNQIQIWYSGFIGMLLTGILNFIGTLMFTLSFQYSLNAGINQGVTSSLISFVPVFCALFAYVLLNETMNIWEFIGMIAAVMSCVVIAFTKNDTEYNASSQKESISPLTPIFLCIVSTVCMALRSIVMKIYAQKGYNIKNIGFQSLFVDGFIGTIILVFVTNSLTEEIPTSIIIYCIIAGIIGGLGIFCINYAISIGAAGPACALADFNPVIQVILDYIILKQNMDIFQIFGLILGLIGIAIIGVGGPIKYLFEKFILKKKKD